MARSTSPANKLLTLPALEQAMASRRAAGQRVVFTNGCFDLLHRGHVRCLAAAAELGDVLVVGLNSDASVRALKQAGRPLVPQDERAEVVAALESVDYVVVFDEPTAENLVRAIRPDVYVKGGDYADREPPEAAIARALGGEFRLLEYVPGSSTSELLRRLRSSLGAGS